MKNCLYIISLVVSQCLYAQSLTVGSWRDHLPYNNAIDLALLGSEVYVATEEALFVFDQADNSVERLNTLNKLSDVGVSSIASDEDRSQIIVAYENGNIDLISELGVVNIPDLKRATILANKRINSIDIVDDLAYLSCGFGILLLDLAKKEINNTYFIGDQGAYLNIEETAILDNYIFAATEQGIYRADIFESNLADFHAWEKLPFRSLSHFNAMETFAGQLFASKRGPEFNTDTIFNYNGSVWEVFREPYTVHEISIQDERMTISQPYGVAVYDENLSLIKNINTSELELQALFSKALYDAHGRIWIADKYNGLLKYKSGYSAPIYPSGPASADVYHMDYAEGTLWSCSGARSENWTPTWNKNELSFLNRDEWKQSSGIQERSLGDMVSVKIDEKKELVYIGSWQQGLVVLKDGIVDTVYDASNSSLQGRTVGTDGWVNIGGLDLDSKGNLWCTNSQTTEPISQFTKEGEWISYSLGSSVPESQHIAKLMVDGQNQKWIQLRHEGIVVFDETREGSKIRKLNNSENSGNLASKEVFSFVEDLDGEIWVGTDNGISVFYNPEDIFEGENASSIIVQLGDHYQKLLDGERINDIEVDGANRKWFATDNSGVILTSADGTEELLHFTTENSPLLSNQVLDIEINDESGEVFIGTDKGLISYRAEATKAGDSFGDVYVFPNPVRPEYKGLITVTGLYRDANVKFTDISGNLVYETTALGGQAIWDGKTFSGDKVQTGVYLVFCSSEFGRETYVTKLLFIRD